MTVCGFVDRALSGRTINGIPVLAGRFEEVLDICPPPRTRAFVAIGDNQIRLELARQAEALGYELAILRHPSAIVSPSARISPGTVLMPGVIVNANATVARNCIINTACSIDHDNHLAEGVQLGPGVRSAGNIAAVLHNTRKMTAPGDTLFLLYAATGDA